MTSTATDNTAPTATDATPPPVDWVPADRRWAGFDRRTIAPAVFVLGFALVLNMLLPAINHALAYDDPVRAGDVMALGGGVSFTPAEGWNIEQGVRRGEEPSGGGPASAVITDGDVSFAVTVGPFDGDVAALIDQIKSETDAINGRGDLHVTGEPVAVTTAAGEEGLVVRYHSPSTEGVLVAFVRQGIGVKIVATGPPGLSDDAVRDIATMIASLDFGGTAP